MSSLSPLVYAKEFYLWQNQVFEMLHVIQLDSAVKQAIATGAVLQSSRKGVKKKKKEGLCLAVAKEVCLFCCSI